MTRRTLGFGLLGCAHEHGALWVDVVRQDPDAEVVGVWDPDPARGQRFAQEHQLSWMPELDRLLEISDAVGITSETTAHRDHVAATATAGVPTIVEKPLTASRTALAAVSATVSSTGTTVMPNFPKRFDPAHLDLKRMVEDGDLGRLCLVRIRHGHDHGLHAGFAATWHTDPRRSGGGALLDEGVHALDLARWLFGDPRSVSATTSCRTLDLPVDDTAAVHLTYDDGPLVDITTGWAFAAAEASVELYGTRGTAVLSGVDLASHRTTRAELKVSRRGQHLGDVRWEARPAQSRFGTPAYHGQGPLHLLDCVRTGRPPAITIDDGLAAVGLVLAAYESADLRRPDADDPDSTDVTRPRARGATP